MSHMSPAGYVIDLEDETGAIFTHTVPRATTDQFLRDLVANSGDNGISPADQQAALEEFALMHAAGERDDDTISAAAYRLWADGRLGISWHDGKMFWKLTGKTA